MARALRQFHRHFLIAGFTASAICGFAAQVDKVKDPNLPGGKGKWTDTGTWQGGGQVPNNTGGLSFNAQISSGTVEIDSEITVTSLLLDTSGGIVTGTATTGSQAKKLTVQGKGSTWKAGSLLGTNGAGEFVVSSSGDQTQPDLTITTASPKSLSNWTLTNAGSILWDEGLLSSGNAAVVRNEPGALFTTTFDGVLAHDLGGTQTIFSNAGTFRKSGGGGRTEIHANLQNSGKVEASSGTLLFTGGGQSTGGEFAVADGARLLFAGSYTLSGTRLHGGGTVALANAALALSGSAVSEIAGRFELTEGSSIGGSGSLDVTGTLEWLGGDIANAGLTTVTSVGKTLLSGPGTKRLHAGSATGAPRFDNRGIFALSGAGPLLIGDGLAFDNRGDFDLRGDSVVGYTGTGGIGTLTNNGLFRKTTGTGTATIGGVTFVNNAQVSSKAGTLAFTGPVTSNGGVFDASPGASIQFSGTSSRAFGVNSAFVGGGTHEIAGGTSTFAGDFSAAHLTFSGGTLLGPATLTGSMAWSGGSWTGGDTFVVAPGGYLAIDGAGVKELLHGSASRGGRVLANRGNVVWMGAGGIQLGDGAQLVNSADAYFEIRNDASISYAGRGDFGSVVNNGTMVKSPTGGTTTITQPFTQNGSGMLLIDTGTLAFTSTFTNNDGAILLSPGARLSSTLPLNFGTGALVGAGTISAPTVTAGGFISPGASPGLLTITGDLTLLNTSVLLIELGGVAPGTTHDMISVGGAAVVAGHLSVQLVNGFFPAGTGETFAVLTANGAAGVTGLFSNAAPGQRLFTSDGLGSFVINYGPGSAFGINSVVLSQFQAIPEPSTWAMLGIGAAVVLAGALRRKRRAPRR